MLLKRFKAIIYALFTFVNIRNPVFFWFFQEPVKKKGRTADNSSMRNLIFMILIAVSVLIALLLWSPEVSTGDHSPARLASAGVLR